jgi:hypothetical protein
MKWKRERYVNLSESAGTHYIVAGEATDISVNNGTVHAPSPAAAALLRKSMRPGIPSQLCPSIDCRRKNRRFHRFLDVEWLSMITL